MSGGPTSPTVFYHTLRTELERRHYPQYPQQSWWSALRVADRDDEAVRISQVHSEAATCYDVQARSRWRQPLRDGTLAMVGAACSRWLKRNGCREDWV